MDVILQISSQNIWRMKQFYETYKDRPELSTLLRENTWSNNMHIISKTKSFEEKEFYLKLASKEKYKTKLIDKSILQRKLAELYDMAEEEVKNSQQD